MTRIVICLTMIATFGLSGSASAEELLPPPAAVDEPAAPPATVPSAPPRVSPDPFGPPGRLRAFDPRSRDPRSTPPSRPATPPPSRPVAVNPGETKFSLTLKDGTRLIGKPVGLAKIPMGTTFGDARIPLTVVQSLESQPDGASVKVRLRNGDVVSGNVRAETMKFETAYGEITIPLSAVVKLNFGTAFEQPSATTAGAPSRVVRSGRPTRYTMPGMPGGFPVPDGAVAPMGFVLPAGPADPAPAIDIPR